MSKKHKDERYYCCSCTPYYNNPCCCCDPCCCDPCCCDPCCCNAMMNNPYGNMGNMGNWNNGILEAIIFWLIACGAGLLNNCSILIILLFLLYGWSCDGGYGSGIFGW